MVVTDNLRLAELMRSYRNQGRESTKWLSHSRIGYNYRLSDINCALGIAQLQRIKEMLKKRENVAKNYTKLFKGTNGLILPPENVVNFVRSWFVYVIRLDNSFSATSRDKLCEYLINKGIGCGEYFPPIHLEPFYLKMGFKKGQFPITESIAQRTLALPFYNNLTLSQIRYITTLIKEKLPGLK